MGNYWDQFAKRKGNAGGDLCQKKVGWRKESALFHATYTCQDKVKLVFPYLVARRLALDRWQLVHGDTVGLHVGECLRDDGGQAVHGHLDEVLIVRNPPAAAQQGKKKKGK